MGARHFAEPRERHRSRTVRSDQSPPVQSIRVASSPRARQPGVTRPLPDRSDGVRVGERHRQGVHPDDGVAPRAAGHQDVAGAGRTAGKRARHSR
ncbi:hypothetical protein, partial [Streptomyces clavuligerus]